MAKGQVKQKQQNIDQNVFESLCGIQCTEEEIMSVFDVSKDTLIRWCRNTYGSDFATVFKEKRTGGKASLRRAQWRKAVDGDSTMLIWLGKQYLGQSDKMEQSLSLITEEVRADVEDLIEEFKGKSEQDENGS